MEIFSITNTLKNRERQRDREREKEINTNNMQSLEAKRSPADSQSLYSLENKHIYLDLSSTYKSVENVKRCLQSVGAVKLFIFYL